MCLQKCGPTLGEPQPQHCCCPDVTPGLSPCASAHWLPAAGISPCVSAYQSSAMAVAWIQTTDNHQKSFQNKSLAWMFPMFAFPDIQGSKFILQLNVFMEFLIVIFFFLFGFLCVHAGREAFLSMQSSSAIHNISVCEYIHSLSYYVG